MAPSEFHAIGASALGLPDWAGLALAQSASPSEAVQTERGRTEALGAEALAPANPHPLDAAGRGPEVGNGLLFGRWIEGWIGMRAVGHASPFKARPVPAGAAPGCDGALPDVPARSGGADRDFRRDGDGTDPKTGCRSVHCHPDPTTPSRP